MARKRPRVVWLPPTNANAIDNVTGQSGIQAFRVDVSPAAPTATGEIPLTIDTEDDPQGATSSLSDVENSGYRLRRIVGKIWVRLDQADDCNIEFAIVTAGIIVRRSEQASGLSLALLSGLNEMLTTNDTTAYGDPWIWRRSWLLHNNAAPGAPQLALPGPESNYGINNGSAVDGPHVDQKTARIISSEERLFLDVTVRSNEPGAPSQDEIPVSTLIITDLRVLASMRMSSGNRRNASR